MTDLYVSKLPDATQGLLNFLCALVVEKGGIVKLPVEKVTGRPPGMLRFDQDETTQEIICYFVPESQLPTGKLDGPRIITPGG